MISKLVGRQIADATLADNHIAAAAAIATTKLADGNLFLKSDGSVSLTAVISGIDPTLPAHLATKNYVDGVSQGLDFKQSVRVATTANITLSGTQTIDGIAVVAGDRVLVKNQTTGAQNGIYVVAVGGWTRSTDADVSNEVTTGMHTFVEQGTVNSSSGWVLNTPMPITLGTTALVFSQFSGSGTYSAGNGLTLSGSQFNVVSGNTGIVSSSGSIALTLADSTLTIAAGGLKLSALASGSLLVGNASAVATAVNVSGDATLSNTGALTISNGAITGAKMATLNSGNILVGNVSNVATSVPVIGDATLSNTGALTISNGAVTGAKMAALTNGNILVGSVANVATSVAVGGDATLAANGTLTIAAGAITGAKMAALASGNILVGNGSNVATSVAVTGDVTLTNAGAITVNALAITTGKIAANAIDETKTKRQVAATVLIGQGVAADVAAYTLSGDATMSSTGVVAVAAGIVRITDFIVNETPSGTVNGINTVFTMANTPRVLLSVTYNGQVLESGAGNDFTIAGAVITTLFTPTGTDKIRVTYVK